MTGTKAPEMEIGERVAVALDRLPQAVRHAPIRVHVEQDRPGVADQAKRPTGDHAGSDDARERVHPEPAERTGEQQADNHQHRYRGVGDHVDDRGPHVVVALRAPWRMLEDTGCLAPCELRERGLRISSPMRMPRSAM